MHGESEEPDCVILTDGRKFTVQLNLDYVLHVFRPSPTTGSRWLWIDALCINHENFDERQEQVLRMGHIYSSSQNLLIWLGVEADDSPWAIGAITELAEGVGERGGRLHLLG